MFGVLFDDGLEHAFEVIDRVVIGVLIETVAELVPEKKADDKELLEGGVGFVHDEIEGDLEEEVAFGVMFEFIFDLLDGSFIGVGLGSVVVEKFIDEGSEVEGLVGSEDWGR